MRISDWSSDVCSSDLDEVDAAPGIVAGEPREAEAFPHDPLPRERRIAVDEHGERRLVRFEVVRDRLDRADLAEDDRILRLEVRGVCDQRHRSEEHTSELQSLMRISYAVFCLKKK